MKDRKFAILCWNDGFEASAIELAQKLPIGSRVHFFCKHGLKQCSLPNSDSTFLAEDIDTEPKARNFINAYYKTDPLHSDSTSFLHVILDATALLKDPSAFIEQIEKTMAAADYNVWFSTCTDSCNYVYHKYNPRLQINLDTPAAQALCIGEHLNYTSHSNTHWIVYDMDKVQDQLLRFDEDFTIPMFWIIEFLARRRSTKKQGQLFYMNQYLSVQEELGTFKQLNVDNNISQKTMQEEDTKFKAKCINFAPDNNIDMVLEETCQMLFSH